MFKKRIEEAEHEYLSPYAAFSDQSVEEIGRKKLVILGQYTKETEIESYTPKHLED